MLTRLEVNGFKNLIGADVSFGPFTCIGRANGVGKSNLFDAIRRETLHHITKGEARKHLPFPHSTTWRDSVVTGRRTVPYISTEVGAEKTYIKLRMDGG